MTSIKEVLFGRKEKPVEPLKVNQSERVFKVHRQPKAAVLAIPYKLTPEYYIREVKPDGKIVFTPVVAVPAVVGVKNGND